MIANSVLLSNIGIKLLANALLLPLYLVPAVSMKTIGKMEGIEILGVENVNQAMNLV